MNKETLINRINEMKKTLIQMETGSEVERMTAKGLYYELMLLRAVNENPERYEPLLESMNNNDFAVNIKEIKELTKLNFE